MDTRRLQHYLGHVRIPFATRRCRRSRSRTSGAIDSFSAAIALKTLESIDRNKHNIVISLPSSSPDLSVLRLKPLLTAADYRTCDMQIITPETLDVLGSALTALLVGQAIYITPD